MRAIRSRCLAAAMMAMLGAMSVQAQTSTNETTERTELRVETKAIPFQVLYEFSRDVGAGRLVTARRGVPGQLKKTYVVKFDGDKPVSKTFVEEVRTEPVNEVILMGRAGFNTSRSAFGRGKVLTMTATAYDPSPQTIPGTKGITATGRRAAFGVVAVDPRVIPLGSLVFVEGYGFAIAADTGGAIKGMKIDLCYNSRSTALRFGRKKVRVHVLRSA